MTHPRGMTSRQLHPHGIGTTSARISRQQLPWAAKVLGGALGDDDLTALIAASRTVRAGARQLLLRAEEDRALLLLAGTAKASLVRADGAEVITELIGPGYAANLGVVLADSRTGRDISSLEPVDALSVNGRDLRHLVSTRTGVTSACLRTVLAQYAAADADRIRFAGTCIPQRVANRLVDLATGWGVADGDAVRITLPLTQGELGAWSGASRESVAKVLHTMRADGIIATGRRTFTVLDLPGLRRRCQAPESLDGRALLSTAACGLLVHRAPAAPADGDVRSG